MPVAFLEAAESRVADEEKMALPPGGCLLEPIPTLPHWSDAEFAGLVVRTFLRQGWMWSE